MKKFVALFTLTLMASTAHAISVPFAWSGGDIKADGALAASIYIAKAGSTGALDTGETASGLTFGNIGLIGAGSGTLTVAVDFITPETSTQSVSGAYKVFSVFIFSGGSWTGGTTDFDYNYLGNTGSARLTLNPIDIKAQIGPVFTFKGSITNLGSINGGPTVSLAEPGSLALLGLGLVAMGGMRRRQQS